MPAKRPVGTPRTTRLRKLECECGNITYQSRARIARHGLLTCPCGQDMIPATMEDAALVLSPEQLLTHPEHELYAQKVASVVHGQARKGGLHAAGHRGWTPAEAQAMDYVEAERRAHALETRLNALPQYAGAAHSDPLPF